MYHLDRIRCENFIATTSIYYASQSARPFRGTFRGTFRGVIYHQQQFSPKQWITIVYPTGLRPACYKFLVYLCLELPIAIVAASFIENLT
jgi:hypothetical protein